MCFMVILSYSTVYYIYIYIYIYIYTIYTSIIYYITRVIIIIIIIVIIIILYLYPEYLIYNYFFSFVTDKLIPLPKFKSY